jgi:peptide/nickel transport system permease protein
MIEQRAEERPVSSPSGTMAGVVSIPQGQIEQVPARRGLHLPTFERIRPFLHNRKALVGALMLIFFFAMAILAPVISPGDANDIVARRHLAPSSEHWFGTTGAGQDVFDQTIWGARQTLGVGIMVGILTTMLSALIGMTGGYFGGKIDDLLSLITNVFLIIPALPLLVVLVGFLGSGGSWYFIAVLTVTSWAWGARVLRSQTLSLREKDFVSAAEVSGESTFRIIFGEIFPNMTSLAAANMFGTTIYAIGALSALQFLGLGNPSVLSWGTNLYWASNSGALLTGAWWTVIPSGVAIALVAFAFALINYAVDEVTNPRLRAQRLASDALRKSGRSMRKAGRATPVVRHAA